MPVQTTQTPSAFIYTMLVCSDVRAMVFQHDTAAAIEKLFRGHSMYPGAIIPDQSCGILDMVNAVHASNLAQADWSACVTEASQGCNVAAQHL